MGLPNKDNGIDIQEVVKSLREQRHWLTEVNNLAILMGRLDELNKEVSIRELAKLIGRSKSWMGVSLILVKGLKLYPEIERCPSRNTAYIFLKKKNKLRRFIES